MIIKRKITIRSKIAAEFIGTFWLVLGGCGSAVLAATFPHTGIGFMGVALAFGLAAASFVPAIILGIFVKRMNKEGAVAGMVIGMLLMLYYMMRFKFDWFGGGSEEDWWFGISPEGFGTVAMIVNFGVSLLIAFLSPKPPEEIQEMVENIRIPSGAGEAYRH